MKIVQRVAGAYQASGAIYVGQWNIDKLSRWTIFCRASESEGHSLWREVTYTGVTKIRLEDKTKKMKSRVVWGYSTGDYSGCKACHKGENFKSLLH